MIAKSREVMNFRAYAIISTDTQRVMDGFLVKVFEDLALPGQKIAKLSCTPDESNTITRIVSHL